MATKALVMHEFMPFRPEPAQMNVRNRRAQGIFRFAVASPCACPPKKGVGHTGRADATMAFGKA